RLHFRKPPLFRKLLHAPSVTRSLLAPVDWMSGSSRGWHSRLIPVPQKAAIGASYTAVGTTDVLSSWFASTDLACEIAILLCCNSLSADTVWSPTMCVSR